MIIDWIKKLFHIAKNAPSAIEKWKNVLAHSKELIKNTKDTYHQITKDGIALDDIDTIKTEWAQLIEQANHIIDEAESIGTSYQLPSRPDKKHKK